MRNLIMVAMLIILTGAAAAQAPHPTGHDRLVTNNNFATNSTLTRVYTGGQSYHLRVFMSVQNKSTADTLTLARREKGMPFDSTKVIVKLFPGDTYNNRIALSFDTLMLKTSGTSTRANFGFEY